VWVDEPRAVLAALVILLVITGVAGVLNPSRQDFAWFIRLRRPRWLVFEGWIPVIWLLIYACFAASAWLTWQASWSAPWMVAYLVQLVLVQSYTLAICRSRSLGAGTAIGFAGWVWGIALTLGVSTLSSLAAGLLVPYLLWSPVGTLVTWQMRQLNRGRRP
jgi:tryptophan-rich sensory protein